MVDEEDGDEADINVLCVQHHDWGWGWGQYERSAKKASRIQYGLDPHGGIAQHPTHYLVGLSANRVPMLTLAILRINLSRSPC